MSTSYISLTVSLEPDKLMKVSKHGRNVFIRLSDELTVMVDDENVLQELAGAIDHASSLLMED